MPYEIKIVLKIARYQQRRGAKIERSCNLDQIEQRQVSLAAFNLTHVRTVNPGAVGKRFLRNAFRLPLRTNDSTQLGELSVGVRLA